MSKTHIERRSILKMGAFALAGTAVPLGACTRQNGVTTTGNTIGLPKVRVESERIIRKIAGLRPFRPSGFVVRSERVGSKTIIHNYGHGGCGITLSWGTADMAAKLALETPARQAAVIGCGAVGLATARLLQDRGFQVTIYTKAMSPDTTSNIAGGLFGVTSLVDNAHHTPEITSQIQQAVRFAHRQFQTMTGERYAIRWVETFLLGDELQEQPWDFAITPELFVLKQFKPGEHPFPTKYASSFHTMEIEPNLYLPRVQEDFLARGGRLEVREFRTQDEVARLKEPVIINCTGFGAKTLFNDNEMIPVKGQLTFLLPQPEINYAYIYGSKFVYMFPRSDGILLGGSHEDGVGTLEPDETIANKIFTGNREISVGLKS